MTVSFSAQDLFVSPFGNDAWSGSIAEPNSSKTNGPLKTIEKARTVIRLRKTLGEFIGPMRVYVREGEYSISRPLRFEPQDGAVCYCAYPGEKPVISAGVKITNFADATINGRACFAADVTDIIERQGFFHQLFVNGHRRDRARLPKKDFYRIEEIPENPNSTLKPGSFRCKKGDFKNWSRFHDIEVLTFNLWVEQRMPLLAFDEKTDVVTYARNSWPLREGTNNQCARFIIENIGDECTDPGEWYLDKATKTLFYIPVAGETLATLDAVVSMQVRFLEVIGSADASAYVENLGFNGLTFKYSDWRQPATSCSEVTSLVLRTDKGHPFDVERSYNLKVDPVAGDQSCIRPDTGQSSMGLPGAAYFQAIKNCSIENCVFEHVGWHAIELGFGCKGNRIIGNIISDVGGGGIKLHGESSTEHSPLSTGRNLITDNHIHHCGEVFPGASGIMVMHSFGNLVAHNHVHDMYYTGISAGATWGYRQNLCLANRIEKNVVHDIGKKVLSDCAGIYLLGVHGGTSVRNNIVYNITKSDYGAFGVNIDEGNKHVLVEGNLFFAIQSQAFHVHYGEEIIIRNNIFAFAGEGVIALSRGSDCRWVEKGAVGGGDISMAFTFERNIVVADDQPIFIGGLGDATGNIDKKTFISDLNLFFDVNKKELYFGDGVHGKSGREALLTIYNHDQWKAFGYDHHSIVADPQFTDVAKNDYTLKATSPAFSLGFKQLDIADAGVRPAEKRKGWLRKELTELDTDKFGYW